MNSIYALKWKNMEKNLWWGYKHISGTYQAKRYFDKRDIEEANESDFCDIVVGPFEAEDREQALKTVENLTQTNLVVKNNNEWESLGTVTTWKYHSKVRRISDGVIFEPGNYLVYLGQSFEPSKIIDIRESNEKIFFNMGKVLLGLNDPNVQKICKCNS